MTRDLEEELQALRSRLQALEAIVENSLDAILLTRPDGTILTANPAACRLFDRTEDELRALGREAVVDTTAPGYVEGLEARRRRGRYQGPIRRARVAAALAAVERIRDIVGRMMRITGVRRVEESRPHLPEMLDL